MRADFRQHGKRGFRVKLPFTSSPEVRPDAAPRGHYRTARTPAPSAPKPFGGVSAGVLCSGIQGATHSIIGTGATVFLTQGATGGSLRVEPRTDLVTSFATGRRKPVVRIGAAIKSPFKKDKETK